MLTGKELGKAIKIAIDKKIASGSVKSKAEIARHFGIKPPSIHTWIDRGAIGKEKLQELWRFFSDVVGPEHWGISGTPETEVNYDVGEDELTSHTQRYVFIPSLSVRACCGTGESVDLEEVVGAVPFRRDWLNRHGFLPKFLEVIRAKGISMEPTLSDGDILLIDKSKTTLSPTRSSIYVIKYADEVSVKRVEYNHSENSVTLSSDNHDKTRFKSKTIKLPGNSDEAGQIPQDFVVIGRVLWHAGLL